MVLGKFWRMGRMGRDNRNAGIGICVQVKTGAEPLCLFDKLRTSSNLGTFGPTTGSEPCGTHGVVS